MNQLDAHCPLVDGQGQIGAPLPVSAEGQVDIIIAILSGGAMGSDVSVRLKEHGARVLTRP